MNARTNEANTNTNHKHSESEHCTHIVHPRGGLYRFSCSCGTDGRWCVNKAVAERNAQYHVNVWTAQEAN